MKRDREPCPCCGHLTLRERCGFEICPVCFWEDDGQDDVDAHIDRGGPNGGATLWQARAHFLRFGDCEKVAKDHVRSPTSDEPQTRHWALLDDVAGVGFVLELLGGPEIEYAPYEGDAVTSFDAITKAEPDIVTAKAEDGRVVVSGSAGVLHLRYRELALRFNNGAPLALAALDKCARSYWDEREKASKR